MGNVGLNCLDKGYVRLVDHMGDDLSVVRAARVSYDADWRTGSDEGKDEKLIRYLWSHDHTSPFEACTMTFEVKAPIFVFRQWHRHRTQSYNEVSARYTELPDEYYVPDPSVIGTQAKDNKQARIVGKEDAEFEGARRAEINWYKAACDQSFSEYKTLLAAGWPRELARMVLPLSTYSRMFTTMNLLNLFRFLKLRMHPHAQFEIRVYADAMFEFARFHYPICAHAFKESLQCSDKTP